MCKYCECSVNELFPSLGCNGASITDGRYEDCVIQKMSDDTYCIYVVGRSEGWSDPIKYCPFCGRKLNE